MGNITIAILGTYILSYLGYNSHELVFGDRAPPWHHGMGCTKEGFVLTFNFKGGFASINEELHEIKSVIFRASKKPMEWTQLDWDTQLCHTLEYCNVTTEEEEEYPMNINILEVEWHHEVECPPIEILDISAPLKNKESKHWH